MSVKNRENLLNPFSLPPETNARYIMVLVVFLVFLWEMGILITDVVFGPKDTLAQGKYAQTFDQAIANLPVELVEGQEISQIQVTNLVQRQSMSIHLLGLTSKVILQGSFFPLLFIAVAVVHYFVQPYYIKYRYKLKGPDQERHREEIEIVIKLSILIGISPPKLLFGGLADTQVFGFNKGPTIRLGHSLSKLCQEKPEVFETIMLHELAHIVNGDVSRAYFTQGVWFSSLLASVIFIATRFFIAVVLNWISMADVLRMGSLILAFLFILRTLMYHLLRIREHYADFRVISWGKGAQLEGILEKILENRPSPHILGSILRNHPSEHERLAVIRNPGRFYAVTPDFSLFSGLLIGMLLSYSHALRNSGLEGLTAIFDLILSIVARLSIVRIGHTITMLDLSFNSIVTSGLSFGYRLFNSLGEILAALLAVAVMGAQIQRQVLLDQVTARGSVWSFLTRLQIAFLVALGVELGYLLNMFSMFGYFIPNPRGNYSISQISFMSVIVFGILISFWMIFVIFLNKVLISSHIGRQAPVFKRWFVAMFSLIMLGIFLEPFNFWRVLIIGPYWSYFASDEVMQAGYLSDLTYLTYELMFAFALSCLLWGFLFALVLLFWLRRAIVPVNCPSCQNPVKLKSIMVVGRHCNSCGLEFDRWLYL